MCPSRVNFKLIYSAFMFEGGEDGGEKATEGEKDWIMDSRSLCGLSVEAETGRRRTLLTTLLSENGRESSFVATQTQQGRLWCVLGLFDRRKKKRSLVSFTRAGSRY